MTVRALINEAIYELIVIIMIAIIIVIIAMICVVNKLFMYRCSNASCRHGRWQNVGIKLMIIIVSMMSIAGIVEFCMMNVGR